MDLLNASTAPTPASVAQQIYAASQQGVPYAFLLWHTTPGLTVDREPSRVSLLHLVRYYAIQMGRPPCRWEDETFANRGDVTYGNAYLHLAPAIHVPSTAAIDAALAGDPELKMLGPYGAGDAGV